MTSNEKYILTEKGGVRIFVPEYQEALPIYPVKIDNNKDKHVPSYTGRSFCERKTWY